MDKKQPNQYRSGAELNLANWLIKNNIEFEYEQHKFKYQSSIKGGVCPKCGIPAVQNREYTPDFYFPTHKFFIEVKGRLTSHDRKKMRDVKRVNPKLDVRFLFPSNNKLEKNNDSRYSDWATKFGFPYSLRGVDATWFR
jgi:hypothetical protein